MIRMALIDGPNEPQHDGGSALSKVLPYTTVAVIIVALYVAWVFYSRYERTRDSQRRIAEQQDQKRHETVNEVFGSGEIKFSTFSADSGVLRRGEHTQLCYGVVNARTVKLDPPIEAAKPTYYHCVEIAPAKTTTYTITAEDAKGNIKSQSLTIQVR